MDDQEKKDWRDFRFAVIVLLFVIAANACSKRSVEVTVEQVRKEVSGDRDTQVGGGRNHSPSQ